MISWLCLFMVVPASTLQANHFQLLIWSGTLPKHRFYRYILPQTSFSLSGLSVLATCHSYPSLSQLVPRDATECRHLPCNVSMETLRSQKLGWCGACDFSSDWNPLENILKTSTQPPSTSTFGHAPNICLRTTEFCSKFVLNLKEIIIGFRKAFRVTSATQVSASAKTCF